MSCIGGNRDHCYQDRIFYTDSYLRYFEILLFKIIQAPVSYHVKSSNDSSTIVIFEDKKLANDSYKKLPALFHAHVRWIFLPFFSLFQGKTIDYDKFANTFAPPDSDQVGTSSDSPSSSKACANIPAKPELLMSSIFVDEPALPPIVPNDYSIKTCSICYTDFHAHEFITLECGHFFCPMCIYNAVSPF